MRDTKEVITVIMVQKLGYQDENHELLEKL